MSKFEKNAPIGVFGFCHYKGYEDVTYNWKVIYDDGDFVMWEYSDGTEWGINHYCACYKGKAYACGEVFGEIRDKYDATRAFVEFMAQLES